MKSKIDIGYSVLLALHQCNLADTYDLSDNQINDLDYSCSRDNSAYGHLGAALKSMGFKNAYRAYVETGDLPDLKGFKSDDKFESKSLTSTQIKIFHDNRAVTGYNNSTLYPLFKSGQYRAANAMVKLGYGEIVSSSLHARHVANYFFVLNENTKFNFNTKGLEVW